MKLVSDVMIHYLLRGELNLSVGKAKIMGKKTNSDPIIWIDPTRVSDRQKAWKKYKENSL